MELSKQERKLTLVGSKPPDQSVSDFCKEHQITQATFYYWQKKHRQQEPEQDAVGFAAVEVEMTKGSLVATVQLPGGALITLYHPEALCYIQALL
ncbi:MAG TPA: transposase [Puia sp.]|jgi:transposase-like protein|nr:transposase [Puia sp.]